MGWFHPNVARSIRILWTRLNSILIVVNLFDGAAFVILDDDRHVFQALQPRVINEKCPPLTVAQLAGWNEIQKGWSPFFSYPVVIKPNESHRRYSDNDVQRNGFRSRVTPSPEASKKNEQGKEI